MYFFFGMLWVLINPILLYMRFFFYPACCTGVNHCGASSLGNKCNYIIKKKTKGLGRRFHSHGCLNPNLAQHDHTKHLSWADIINSQVGGWSYIQETTPACARLKRKKKIGELFYLSTNYEDNIFTALRKTSCVAHFHLYIGKGGEGK